MALITCWHVFLWELAPDIRNEHASFANGTIAKVAKIRNQSQVTEERTRLMGPSIPAHS